MTIVPWVECNWPDADDSKNPGRTQLETVIEGLRIWRKVTDRAIVSTWPSEVKRVYPALRKQVRGITIIPGLKTINILAGRLDDLGTWRDLRGFIEDAIRLTKTNWILLDHEAALEPFALGQVTVDRTKLAQGVAKLPIDIRHFWYPSVYWFIDGMRSHRRLLSLVPTIEAIPRVTFLDQRYCGYKEVGGVRHRRAAAAFDEVRETRTMPHLFFYGPKHRHVWWRDDMLREALALVRWCWGEKTDVIIYTGRAHWIEGAKVLSSQLASGTYPRDG